MGVIASARDLLRATRMRRPPDFFELRLDALRNSLQEIERAIPRLSAPLILTARHPAEGGAGHLHLSARRKLILQFLDHATMVDLELRSLPQMQSLLHEMRRRQIGLLLSKHFLDDTPSPGKLHQFVRSALPSKPTILKLAARTDQPAQLERLVSFFLERPCPETPLAAMGMGKFGLESRLQLDRLGSALTYFAFSEAGIQGQPSLTRLRRLRNAYNKKDPLRDA
ncbi:MAG: type I 3-dehydroquinate dehydratase [Chthoniobacterales bacterium]